MRVVILGPPGAGKGSCCEALKEALALEHCSTGDMLRAEIRQRTTLGRRVEEVLSRGGLVTDEVMIPLVVGFLRRLEAEGKSWLLDGFPRTAKQASALLDALPPHNVLVLGARDETVIGRIAGRRVDPATNAVYHVTFKPPPPGVKVVLRPDDARGAIEQRLRTYARQRKTVEAVFRTGRDRACRVTDIDANRETKVVAKDALATLGAAKL